MACKPLDLTEVGRRLRGVREARGWTQRVLAERLGVGQGWLSDLERAKQTHIQADTIFRLCQVLGCSADYLLGLPTTGALHNPLASAG